MVTLMNINKVAHHHNWVITYRNKYGFNVLPKFDHGAAGYCGPTAIALLTHSNFKFVIDDIRTYDKSACRPSTPGTSLNTVDAIMQKLFNVRFYVDEHNTPFNSAQEWLKKGTYLFLTRAADGSYDHYTILQDGMEYGTGTSTNHTVLGYWRLD